MDTAVKDAIERLASMIAAGIPQTQIAEALGLSEGRISQLKDTDEFRTALAEKQAAKFEEQQELNDGWDSVERRALKVVVDNLKWNNNPDFALKAAMVANRATRRGGNQTLPTNMGSHAVINLSVNFLQKLQGLRMPAMESDEVSETGEVNSPSKTSDLMSPDGIATLLAPRCDDAGVADAVVDVRRFVEFACG